MKPHYRTQPSTLDAIKQECEINSPSVVYHHVLEEAVRAVASVPNSSYRICLPFVVSQKISSILGVDATFQLSDFYVTLMTYHNPSLINPRTGKPPVFIGPAFLHMQRHFEHYLFLPSIA